jgi:hypothetical protein
MGCRSVACYSEVSIYQKNNVNVLKMLQPTPFKDRLTFDYTKHTRTTQLHCRAWDLK